MSEGNIYEKLRKVQLELKAPKSQRNTFGNYNYRNVEDIIEAAKPVLDRHGLTLIVSDEMVCIGDRYYVHAVASVYDGSKSEFEGLGKYSAYTRVDAHGYARESEEKKGMDSAQITGAASSYSRKYALNGLLAIDDTKDADSDEHTAQRRTSAPAASTKPTAPAKPALVTVGQAQLLLSKAKLKWKIDDRVQLLDEFISRYAKAVNEVEQGAEYDEILEDLRS